ncbi:MAG: hypothetical protein ABJH52_16120 [Henriciella sp.]
MATDIGKVPTRELDEEGAFRRSRNGAIVLTILFVSYVLQFAVFAFPLLSTFPALLSNAQSDETAAITLSTSIMFGGLILVSVILALLGWLMRSRIAMRAGFGLFALNWLFYILVWMTGEAEVSGILLNILGPYYLWKGVMGANRYHTLRQGKVGAADASVFE